MCCLSSVILIVLGIFKRKDLRSIHINEHRIPLSVLWSDKTHSEEEFMSFVARGEEDCLTNSF